MKWKMNILLDEVRELSQEINRLHIRLSQQQNAPLNESQIGKIHGSLPFQKQNTPLDERVHALGVIADDFALTAKEVVVFLQGVELRKELVNFVQHLVSQMKEQSEKQVRLLKNLMK